MSIPVPHFQPDNQRCNESWIAPKCCTHCNTSAYIHLMLCGITNNTVESSSHHIPLAILNLLPTQLNHLHAVLLHLIRLAAGRCCTCRRLRISFLQQWHDQLRQQRGLLAQELHISADRRGMNGVVQHLSLLQIQFHRLHQLLMQQTNIQYIPIGVGPVLDRRLLIAAWKTKQTKETAWNLSEKSTTTRTGSKSKADNAPQTNIDTPMPTSTHNIDAHNGNGILESIRRIES